MSYLDFPRDASGAVLTKANALIRLPDFAKNADVDDLRNVETLPDSSFACPEKRAYPCHSPASTFVSAVYFTEKKAELNPSDVADIEHRLLKLANFHQIELSVRSYMQKRAELDQPGEPQDNDFAFGDAKQGTLPIRTPSEIQKVASWLEEHRLELQFEDKCTIANRVLDKCAAIGVELSNREFLEKQAGRGFTTPKSLAELYRSRKVLTKCAEEQTALEKAAQVAEKIPSVMLSRDTMIKAAVSIDLFDRSSGLIKGYGGYYQPPEDTIFGLTYKEAREAVDNCCQLQNGKAYDNEDFTKLSLSEVRDVFGEDFANRVKTGSSVDPTKFSEVAATMPEPDADSLSTMLSAKGVSPSIEKDAFDVCGTSLGNGLTVDWFKQQAAV